MIIKIIFSWARRCIKMRINNNQSNQSFGVTKIKFSDWYSESLFYKAFPKAELKKFAPELPQIKPEVGKDISVIVEGSYISEKENRLYFAFFAHQDLLHSILHGFIARDEINDVKSIDSNCLKDVLQRLALQVADLRKAATARKK